jgi:hypothetical protein
MSNRKDYLTRSDALFALRKMKKFHNDLDSVMTRNGFSLLENLGRRNILLSCSQEKFFSDALARRYDVINDGRTGEPDIMIKSLGRELECKLTSRQKSGAISFQTDYATLKKKKNLDYLYVVANKTFDEFAVIHYTDLTTADFRKVSTGARGKTQLMKHKAIDRASVLLGGFENINERELKKLNDQLSSQKVSPSRRKKLLKSIEYWEKTPTKYSIALEGINAIKSQ